MDDWEILTERLKRGRRARDLGWSDERVAGAFDEAIHRQSHPDMETLKDIHENCGDMVTDEDVERMTEWFTNLEPGDPDWHAAHDFQGLMGWSTERAQVALDRLCRAGRLTQCYVMLK